MDNNDKVSIAGCTIHFHQKNARMWNENVNQLALNSEEKTLLEMLFAWQQVAFAISEQNLLTNPRAQTCQIWWWHLSSQSALAVCSQKNVFTLPVHKPKQSFTQPDITKKTIPSELKAEMWNSESLMHKSWQVIIFPLEGCSYWSYSKSI